MIKFPENSMQAKFEYARWYLKPCSLSAIRSPVLSNFNAVDGHWQAVWSDRTIMAVNHGPYVNIYSDMLEPLRLSTYIFGYLVYIAY